MTEAATWSTDAVAPRRAFTAWTEKMSELHLAWALTRPPEEQFSAQVHYRRLNELTLADFRGGRFAGVRSVQHKRTGGEQFVGVLVNVRGHLVCRYAGDDILVGPDEMLIWDSELAQSFNAVEPHHELSVMLPRAEVPESLAAFAAQTTSVTPLGRGSGLAAVAAAQLRAIAREMSSISDAGMSIAFQSFFDTLDAALAPIGPEPLTCTRAALLARIRGHIEDNLDDPNLGASSIATAHGISVRSVHLLFADTGTTVSRWIRNRRLQICYRELSRARPGKTVTDVAFQWGFNDSAHFSRSFKQAFGVTPSSVLTHRGSALAAGPR